MRLPTKFLLAAGLLAGAAVIGIVPVYGTECIPRDAYSVITPGADTVPAVYETVVTTEAGWQRYSLTGKWKHDYAPEFPIHSLAR